MCSVDSDLLQYIKEKNLQPAPVPSIPLPAGVPSSPPVAAVAPRVAIPVSPAASPSLAAMAPRVAAPAASPPQPTLRPGDTFVDIPLTNMRSIIAKRLTQSKVSMFTHFSAYIKFSMACIMCIFRQAH